MPIPFVYIASQSPRRRELLAQIGVTHEVFDIAGPEGRAVDETPRAAEAPIDYVKRVARTKAAVGWRRLNERHLPVHPLLAADTTVAIGEQILGKPSSAHHGAQMLAQLSGRTHQVYTAIALAWDSRIETALSQSSVKFRALTEAEIERYVASREGADKAGGYAVQGRAAIFIERIDGSFSGVMGLPLYETSNLLVRAGLELL